MAFVLGEFIAVQNNPRILLVVFLVVFLALLIIKIITKQQVAVFVVIFLFAAIGFLLTEHEIKNSEMIYRLEEDQVEITGKIDKVRKNQLGFSIFLQEVRQKGKNINKVIVYTDNVNDLKIGNIIHVSGKIRQFPTERNQGNFNSRNYYRSLGIYVGIEAKKIWTVNKGYDVVRQNMEQLKRSIKEKLDRVCNDGEKGILNVLHDKNTIYEGILLGDKEEMDMELKEQYSLSGIAHVLAISGLHISIIGMSLYSLLRRRFRFGVSSAVSVIVVVAFGILSGMGIATVRALVMFGLKLMGDVLGRNYDYVTSISMAGIFMMLGNPFVIYNSGFQMSFVAIISIVIVWKKVKYILQLPDENKKVKCILQLPDDNKKESILHRAKSKIIQSILFSLTITICMNPIVAYYYFALPTYSFLLNMIIVPLMSIVVVSGVAGIAASYIGVGLGRLAILPGCFILEIYEKLCNLVLSLPFASVIVGKPSLVIVYIYYAFILLSLLLLERKRKHFLEKKEKNRREIPKEGISMKQYMENKDSKQGKAIFIISFVLLIIVLNLMIYCYIPVCAFFTERDTLEVDVLDVGQGDGIVIQSPKRRVITIDGGSNSVDDVGKYRIIPYLKSRGIKRIDYAVMTHADNDHISGLIELMEQSDKNGVKVKNLVLPDIQWKDSSYCQMVEIAGKHNIHVLYISKDKHIKLGEVEFQCIHPDENTLADNRNDYSTVLKLTYRKFYMLFTGDISSDLEKKMLDSVNSGCTVLKVAHHGSKYSSSDEFLQKLTPRYSVISVGENNLYGHPSNEVLKRLEKYGSKVLRTDEDGEIMIRTDGENMEIERLIK